jgi:hypothetical protein
MTCGYGEGCIGSGFFREYWPGAKVTPDKFYDPSNVPDALARARALGKSVAAPVATGPAPGPPGSPEGCPTGRPPDREWDSLAVTSALAGRDIGYQGRDPGFGWGGGALRRRKVFSYVMPLSSKGLRESPLDPGYKTDELRKPLFEKNCGTCRWLCL